MGSGKDARRVHGAALRLGFDSDTTKRGESNNDRMAREDRDRRGARREVEGGFERDEGRGSRGVSDRSFSGRVVVRCKKGRSQSREKGFPLFSEWKFFLTARTRASNHEKKTRRSVRTQGGEEVGGEEGEEEEERGKREVPEFVFAAGVWLCPLTIDLFLFSS